MCKDWASVAKRGSRLVGLDSMRKVREEGSGVVWEQPEREDDAMKQRSKEVTRTPEGELAGGFLARRGMGDFT